jgi:sugar-specific transcriptional regulator TrmB
MELALQKPSISLNTKPNNRQPDYSLFNEKVNSARLTFEEMFESFGMVRNEIKVYLHLAEVNSAKAKDICDAVKIHRTETYRLLHHLEKKGLVYTLLEKPVKFSAIPIDKAIDLLVATQRTRMQTLQNKKEELVKLWLSMPKPKCEEIKKQLFQKLEGEQQIILKANELLDQTKKELQIFLNDQYLAEFYYSGFFDKLKKLNNKHNISLITSSSAKGNYFLEKIKWPNEKHQTVSDLDLPCFIISDKTELLITFNEAEGSIEIGHKKKVKSVAVWTNCQAVVSTLAMLYMTLCPNIPS